MNKSFLKDLPFFLLMILAMSFWGASWASGKIIANRVPPDVIVFWRFTLTFLSFFVMLLIFNRNKFKLPVSKALWIFLNEKPTTFTIIGGLLALIAIYIINFFSEKVDKNRIGN